MCTILIVTLIPPTKQCNLQKCIHPSMHPLKIKKSIKWSILGTDIWEAHSHPLTFKHVYLFPFSFVLFQWIGLWGWGIIFHKNHKCMRGNFDPSVLFIYSFIPFFLYSIPSVSWLSFVVVVYPLKDKSISMILWTSSENFEAHHHFHYSK